MKKPLVFARELVSAAVQPGGLAIDATCGNGHDTQFLAELTGSNGSVLAFDVQPEAIGRTRQRLADAGLLERVTLLGESHEYLGKHLQGQKADAVMFNLGYLPGGNHAIVTRPETTKAALETAILHLNRGGVITLVIYTGHAGGKEEYQALRDYTEGLPQQEFTAIEYKVINQVNNPPLLMAITRL